jgi:hypothetical protein
MIAEMLSDVPVPVGTKAIAPAKPDTQNKPGECCEQERYQIPFSEFWKDPPKDITKD